MAERRMFAKTVIGSDAFLDLPPAARLLYYDLAMRADDDGFVSAPKKIMRENGTAPADLETLIESRFLLSFENGIVVIRHWKAHNYIQNDRYHPTVYQHEKSMLTTEGNCYELRAEPACIHSVSILDTEDRIESEKEIEIEQEIEQEQASEKETDHTLTETPSSSGKERLFSLPTKEKKEFVVGEETVREYRSLWPELDVKNELLAMRSWLLANPERQKTAADTPRFIYGWLRRSHEQARASPGAQKETPRPFASAGAPRRESCDSGGSYKHTPSYDIKLAMEQMKTTVPKLKKKPKR